MTADTAGLLEAARDHWERGERDEALELLLEIWRTSRSPVVRQVLLELDERVCDRRASPFQGSVYMSRVLEVASRGNACDTGVLFRLLGRLTPTQGCTLLEQLAERMPDPRVVTSFLQLCRAPPRPFLEERAEAFWRDFGALMLESIDSGISLDAALEVTGQLRSTWPHYEAGRTLNRAQHELAQLDPPKAVPGARTWLRSLCPVAEEDLAFLTSCVHADPSDLEARSILSDALMVSEDPRGEFIALQLSGVTSPEVEQRTEKLLTKHRREWLGDLASVLDPASVRFAAGFPVEGQSQRRLGLPSTSTLRDRAWRTFESLNFRGWREAHQLVVHNDWPVLATLRGCAGHVLAHRGLSALTSFMGTATLPQLREARAPLKLLMLNRVPTERFPWEARVFETLEALTIAPLEPGSWLELAPTVPGSFVLVIHRLVGCMVYLPGRRTVELHSTRQRHWRQDLGGLCQEVRGVDEVLIRVPAPLMLPEDESRVWCAQLSKQTSGWPRVELRALEPEGPPPLIDAAVHGW